MFLQMRHSAEATKYCQLLIQLTTGSEIGNEYARGVHDWETYRYVCGSWVLENVGSDGDVKDDVTSGKEATGGQGSATSTVE